MRSALFSSSCVHPLSSPTASQDSLFFTYTLFFAVSKRCQCSMRCIKTEEKAVSWLSEVCWPAHVLNFVRISNALHISANFWVSEISYVCTYLCMVRAICSYYYCYSLFKFLDLRNDEPCCQSEVCSFLSSLQQPNSFCLRSNLSVQIWQNRSALGWSCIFWCLDSTSTGIMWMLQNTFMQLTETYNFFLWNVWSRNHRCSKSVMDITNLHCLLPVNMPDFNTWGPHHHPHHHHHNPPHCQNRLDCNLSPVKERWMNHI